MTIQDRCSMIDESESGVAEKGQSMLDAIDKIYSGFYSLKEACSEAYKNMQRWYSRRSNRELGDSN